MTTSEGTILYLAVEEARILLDRDDPEECIQQLSRTCDIAAKNAVREICMPQASSMDGATVSAIGIPGCFHLFSHRRSCAGTARSLTIKQRRKSLG